MKANIKKPKKPPKEWARLPDYEKKALKNFIADEIYNGVDRDMQELQEIWIKMSCIIQHNHGATEEELHAYIAEWKRMYRRNERTGNREAQKAWLDAEMAKCFPNGFPQFRIDELKNAEEAVI